MEPREPEHDPEVMVVDPTTPLETAFLVGPLIAVSLGLAVLLGRMVDLRYSTVAVWLAMVAAMLFSMPLLLITAGLVSVDFLLDRRDRTIRVRRRFGSREWQQVVATFADVAAVRIRGRSRTVKGKRRTTGWIELELVSGRRIALSDGDGVASASRVQALIAAAEPIAAHLDAPLVPASLTKKTPVTPERWSHAGITTGQQWAVLATAGLVWVGLLVWPFVSLATRSAYEPGHPPVMTMLLSGPAGILTLLAGWATTRSRLEIDARAQRVRREGCTFLVPAGRLDASFAEVASVRLVTSELRNLAWLEIALRDGRAVPAGEPTEVDGRDGLHALLDAEGRALAAMIGAPFAS